MPDEPYKPEEGDSLPFSNPTAHPIIARTLNDAIETLNEAPSVAFAAAIATIQKEIKLAEGSNTRAIETAAGTATAIQGLDSVDDFKRFFLNYVEKQEAQGQETNAHLANIAASTERLIPIENTLRSIEKGDQEEGEKQAGRDNRVLWAGIIIGLGGLAIAVWAKLT